MSEMQPILSAGKSSYRCSKGQPNVFPNPILDNKGKLRLGVHTILGTMTADASPDSIPSLMEVSHASSDGDELSRVLFGAVDNEVELVHPVGANENPRNVESGARKSSVPKRITVDGFTITQGLRLIPFYGYQSAAAVASSPMSSPDSRNEDDRESSEVPIQPSCHNGLNLSPKQLADIFTIFDGSQRDWPPSQVDAVVDSEASSKSPERATKSSEVASDAVTAVTSNTTGLSTISWERKIDSLERECVTLKDIIRRDSTTILKLKTELEKARKTVPVRLSDTKPFRAEIALLKKDRDLLAERESQHLETIRYLKDEVNHLTKSNVATSMTQKEIDQLRLENELFAQQIIENEGELRDLHRAVKLLQEENANIKIQLEALSNESRQADTDRSQQDISQGISDFSLRAQVELLAKRLADIERGRDAMALSIEEESRRRHEEFENLKLTIQQNHSSISEPGEEKKTATPEISSSGVEVTLKEPNSPKKENHDAKGKKDDATGWGSLCDCFPSVANDDDD